MSSTELLESIIDTEPADPHLTAWRKRESELEVDLRKAASVGTEARENVISGHGDHGAVDAALSRQSGIESALAELRTRIAQRQADLAEQRQADAEEAAKAKAIKATREAVQLLYRSMTLRECAVAELLELPAAEAFVNARRETYEAQVRALECLKEVTGGDRAQAMELLEAHGLDARALQTPIYPSRRYLDRRGGVGWGMPVEPLWRAYPEIQGGDLFEVIADRIEFDLIVPPGASLAFGGDLP